MKATGIIRRVDDLGRIVIPREIRRNFGIEDGDPMEIFTDAQGIFIQKYIPGQGAEGYIEAIKQVIKQDSDISNENRKVMLDKLAELEAVIGGGKG